MSPLSGNANLCRRLNRPSGKWSRAGLRYHSSITPRSEFGVAESRFWPVLSQSVGEAAKYMNAQVRMCACQLWLYFFPVRQTLLQVFQRNGIDWWSYAHAVLDPSVPKPPAA